MATQGLLTARKKAADIMKGDVADLLHAVRQHGVTGRREDGHSGQHQILAKGQMPFSVVSCQFSVETFGSNQGENRELVANLSCPLRPPDDWPWTGLPVVGLPQPLWHAS